MYRHQQACPLLSSLSILHGIQSRSQLAQGIRCALEPFVYRVKATLTGFFRPAARVRPQAVAALPHLMQACVSLPFLCLACALCAEMLWMLSFLL